MKKNLFLPVLILIAISPLVYLAIIWKSIPQTIVLHFNGSMQPDRYGDKSELWIIVGIMAIVSTGLFFLLANISKIDPKQKKSGPSPVFNKIGLGILIFMTALNYILIEASYNSELALEKIMFPLVGLLFSFIGNYMYNIKPNYFAGFRLPWTLSNDNNWRKTHHLASKIWFAGGILIAVISFLLTSHLILPVFISLTLVMVFIPSVYSYRLFRREKANSL